MSLRTWRNLRNWYCDLRAIGPGTSLDRLGKIYGTDKFGAHFYTQHYQTHFNKFKYQKVNVLEIGVGGYDDPQVGGNSLRMWKKYFPSGQIFSFDIYDKSALQESRIKIFKGSQVDPVFLEQITKEIGTIDLIIDDGSHLNEHVIETFGLLFPKLKEGGIYVVEDIQTSYWSDFGGHSKEERDAPTIMNYFKSLCDGLNYMEYETRGYQPTYLDEHITSIHFYHNLIFIYKGSNREQSNRSNVFT